MARLVDWIDGANDLGKKRTKAYDDLKKGLIVEPIKDGRRSFMLDTERDALVRAYAAGLPQTELRVLVQRLHQERKVAA